MVSLTSSLVVKMLTVLVSTVSKSQVFRQKNVSSFCKCYSHFFSKHSAYAISNDQNINDRLTNDIVSLEQIGLWHTKAKQISKYAVAQRLAIYLEFKLGLLGSERTQSLTKNEHHRNHHIRMISSEHYPADGVGRGGVFNQLLIPNLRPRFKLCKACPRLNGFY